MNIILKTLLKPFLALFLKVDGWKSIVGYLVTELTNTLMHGNPLVAESIKRAMEDPSGGNIAMALGQCILAIGLLCKGIKNVGSK